MFVFMSVLLYRVFAHVRLDILATIVCFYVCVDVEDMYTCKTWNFGNEPMCLYLCWLHFFVLFFYFSVLSFFALYFLCYFFGLYCSVLY